MSAQPNAPRRDRLRELLDAVVDDANTDVPGMARSSFASAFHFSREVSRLTGEPPAALRRRVMLERAAWRLQRGEGVAAVALEEGWSAPEVCDALDVSEGNQRILLHRARSKVRSALERKFGEGDAR